MRCLIILMLLATIHSPVFASRTIAPGNVVSYRFTGTRDHQIFVFKLSSKIKNLASCNTTGSYAIDSHIINGVYMTSILLNLHNHTMNGWMKLPAVAASGTGACKLSPNAEDARLVILNDAGKYAFEYSLPYGSTKQIISLDHSYHVIFNMSHRAHATEPIILGYYDDLCVKKNAVAQVNGKWAVSGYGGIDASDPDSFFWNTIGSEAKKFMNHVQRFATCADLGNLSEGIQFYSESIANREATAMWRNQNGQFHGAILHKENGRWKMFDSR